MKKVVTISAVVLGVLVALVVILVVTPVGWRLARGLLERTVEDRSGLDLTIGSLRGNLVSNVTVTDARLAVPDGPTIAEIGKLEAAYDLRALVMDGRVIVPAFRVSNAEFLFEVGPDSQLIGWPRFAEAGPDTAEPAEPPEIDVNLELVDWAITARDTAAGYEVRITGLDAAAEGGPDAFRASLDGSLSVAAKGLTRPVRGAVSAEIDGTAERLRIARLDVPTDAGDAAVRGLVTLAGRSPALHLEVESGADLGVVAGLLRPGDGAKPPAAVRGRVSFAGTVEGPVDSMRYRATVVGTGVVAQGVEVPRVDIEASGNLDRVEVERFDAAVLGGRVTGSATADLTGLREDPARVPYDVSVRLAGLDLATLAPLLPEGGTAVEGKLSGSARLAAASQALPDLRSSFDIAIEGLAIGDAALGTLTVEGGVAGAILEAEARCCESVVVVEAPLEESGIGEISFRGDLLDLSTWGTVYGAPELRGHGTVEGAVSLAPEGVALDVQAVLPELTYKEFEVGPARVGVTGRDTSYTTEFTALGDVVEGTGTFDTGGSYRISARADSFDLGSLMDDDTRERLAFEGFVTAAATVSGRGQTPPAVEGTVLDLSASARGQHAYLETPFQFEATRDTIHITWASIAGSLGALSVMGGIGVRESGEIVARFDGVDLASIAALVPDGLPAPLGGIVRGDVRLVGRRDRPDFTADIEVADFAFGDLGLRTVSLEAESDASDVIFDLRAESAVAGSVMAYGSMPVVPDSLRLMLPDPTREFGVSVVFTDFTLDAGIALLPGIRGTKRFTADGAVLMVGQADSLASLHGRGSFGTISARFDLVDFALAEPLEFELAGGDIELAETAFVVTRRRALGDLTGGTASVVGVVRRGGSMDLTIRAEALDVGQLVRAFGPDPRATASGKLDAEARITGTTKSPVVDFSWDLARPGFQDVGFERSSGRGRLADQVIELERAALSSGGRSISAEGRIPLAASAEHGGEPSAGHELDLRISADDFRLAGLTKLPPGLKRLDGRLTINLAVRGPMDAPVPEGTITLRDGIVSGFDLDRPIRDIGFEIGARGGTVVLERASAKLGDGAVTATGFVDVGAGKEPTFWLRTKLESAEVSVEDSFDARFAGMLTWAGALRGSEVSGRVLIEKLDVTYPIGLIDLLTRRRGAVMVRRPSAALSRISLDVDIDVEDEINVRNDLARLALKGGFHVDGTALAPEISGGLYTDGGTFTYLDNRFEIETLDVTYVDPTRRDPRVLLVGTSTVTDQSEEEYLVTVRFEGFAFETLPQLSSDPPLTQGDIVALLTFGNTFGGLAAGAGDVGSSGDRFSQLARGAFVSSLFGVAEVALERMLRLDTVSVEQQDGAEGEIVGADLTVGKVFADRLRVNYTTAVGEFGDQEIEVALRLSRRISIETRADPEGNHGIGLRLRLPFK